MADPVRVQVERFGADYDAGGLLENLVKCQRKLKAHDARCQAIQDEFEIAARERDAALRAMNAARTALNEHIARLAE